MMKLQTSLINIRYAVGVMLAMSAVIAVLIGNSNISHATHGGDVTLTLSAPEDVSEADATFVATLVAGHGTITGSTDVRVDVSGDPSLTLPEDRTFGVTVHAENNSTFTQAVGFTNGVAASGKRVVTLSLQSPLPDGFTTTTQSVKVTIHDDEDTKATGNPVIVLRQDPDGPGDGDYDNVVDGSPNDGDTDNGPFSLKAEAVVGGNVSVGDFLVANLSGIGDKDGLDDARGSDNKLGVVSGGRIATNATGAVNSDGEGDADNVNYQWTRINGEDDDTSSETDDESIDNSNHPRYQVATEDIGKYLKVEAIIADDAHATNVDNDNLDRTLAERTIYSSTVYVPPVLRILTDDTDDPDADDKKAAVSESGQLTFYVRAVNTSLASPGLTLDTEIKTTSGPTDIDLPSTKSVTLVGQTVTVNVGFSNRTNAQGPRVVTVSLPESIDGYKIDAEYNTVTFTIHDDEDTKATGNPVIVLRQDPDGPGDGDYDNVVDGSPNDGDTDNGPFSLKAEAVVGGKVSVGDVLVADLGAIADKDGLVTAKGSDEALGVVTNRKIATNATGGVNSDGIGDGANVNYQWTRIIGEDDDTSGGGDDENIGTDHPRYVVVDADIGKYLKVEAIINDDAHAAGFTRTEAERTIYSSTVFVPPTLSISTTQTYPTSATADQDVTEDSTGPLSFYVVANAALSADLTLSNIGVAVEGKDDINLPKTATATIDISASPTVSTIVSLNFDDRAGAQGQRIVTISLPNAVDGFAIDEDHNSLTFVIHDNEDSDATPASGGPVLNVLGDNKQIGTTDNYERAATAAPAKIGVGAVLVADLKAIADDDGLVKASGDDGVMGVVVKGKVKTAQNGVVSATADDSTNDDHKASYSWGTLAENGDFTAFATAVTTPSLTVTTDHLGDTLAVQVSFKDDAHGEGTSPSITRADETRVSNGVKIASTLTISTPTDVSEAAEKVVVTVNVNGAAPTSNLTVSGIVIGDPDGIVEPTTVDVTVNASATSGEADVDFTTSTAADGPETITVTLPSSVDGYIIGSPNTSTTTIHDAQNSSATGRALVYRVNNIDFDGDGIYVGQLHGGVGPVAAGYTLIAKLTGPGPNAIVDADGLVKAKGKDGYLGVVSGSSNTIDLVTPTSATSAPDTTDTDAKGLTYQWGMLSDTDNDGESDDFTAFTGTSNGERTVAYTIQPGDVGSTIAVRVRIEDDATQAITPGRDFVEEFVSHGVKVANTINIRLVNNRDRDFEELDEGESVTIRVSRTGATTDPVTVPLNKHSWPSATAGSEIPTSVTIAATASFAEFTYTAPAVTGRQFIGVWLNDASDNENWPPNYAAHSWYNGVDLAIKDGVNNLPTVTASTLTINNASPQIGDVLIATLTEINDLDLDPRYDIEVTFTWYAGSSAIPGSTTKATYPGDSAASRVVTDTYTVGRDDAGAQISVKVQYNDGCSETDDRVWWDRLCSAGTMETITSAATAAVEDPKIPLGGLISEIKPGIRDVTVSGGDTVSLSVDVYGLQDKQDQKLAGEGVITWSAVNGTITAVKGTSAKVNYKASSTPGSDTITATVGKADCRPADEKMRAEKCSATIPVKVRRPSPPQPEDEAPVNPATIPSILADGSGNQYEVFTPVEGGTFDQGEGYWLTAESGDVPNGEVIGVRMSDDGAASNMGMTHQRYTLGGNMYGIHVVDAAGSSISSYVLDDPAQVCVPLPAELASNISKVALVALNADDTLTILSSSVKLGSSGTSVCGNISTLPASVAVGTSGAPDAIPTATPEPTPEPPDTGGTAPSDSNGMLVWAILLGLAITGVGTVLAMARRRRSSSQS